MVDGFFVLVELAVNQKMIQKSQLPGCSTLLFLFTDSIEAN